ncbi:PucR family transcriptional regulator [Alkalihalobacillus pseudalcaliphilus]|nr:PucR family transcriptional regulator [Alkalihalobacillus pseudalcaliphilus]
MTLAHILELHTFQQVKVLAGKNGLHQSIQFVHLTDIQETPPFINKEQLLLTTLYSSHSKENLFQLVKHLVEKNSAGIGFKVSKNMQQIPTEIIQFANQSNFPILELPLHYSIEEMLSEALGFILKEQTTELQSAYFIHQEFTQLISSGGGFHILIDRLTQLTALPIVLLNERLNIISASPLANEHLFFDVYQYLYELIYEVEYEQPQYLELPYDENKHVYGHFYIFPILASKKPLGYLVLLGAPDPLPAATFLTIEHSANVLSFELMKRQAIEKQVQQEKDEFFTDLINGTLQTHEEIQHRGSPYNIVSFQNFICIVYQIDFENSAHPLNLNRKEVILRERSIELIEKRINEHYHDVSSFKKEELFITFIDFDKNEPSFEKNLMEILQVLHTDIFQLFDTLLSVGISTIHEDLLEVPIAFQESIDALESDFHENSKTMIRKYHTQELSEIIKAIPLKKLKTFYLSSLRELAKPNDKEKEDLMITLMTYLNHHCQISETAKSLFVHRNTVIYRIKKCEELLGNSLKNPDETLKLRLALFARPLIERYIK